MVVPRGMWMMNKKVNQTIQTSHDITLVTVEFVQNSFGAPKEYSTAAIQPFHIVPSTLETVYYLQCHQGHPQVCCLEIHGKSLFFSLQAPAACCLDSEYTKSCTDIISTC